MPRLRVQGVPRAADAASRARHSTPSAVRRLRRTLHDARARRKLHGVEVMPEIWRRVPGHKGYEVSSLGKVRSTDRIVLCSGTVKGLYQSRKIGRVLKPGRKTCGHMSVVLGRSAGSHSVHALVMSAFVGPRPTGCEIRHKNGNPADNRLVNLEYSSRSRNGQDKKWHAGQSTYKLNPEQAASIIRRLQQGARGNSLAEEFGVSESTISAIKHGRFHKDVRASL